MKRLLILEKWNICLQKLKKEGVEDTSAYKAGFYAGIIAMYNILENSIVNESEDTLFLMALIKAELKEYLSQLSPAHQKSPPV